MTQLISQLEDEVNKMGAAWNLFGTVDRLKSVISKMKRGSSIPKGWIVLGLGQSPMLNLWFCRMVNSDDVQNGVNPPRNIFVEDYDTMEDAIFYASERIRLSYPTSITCQ